MNIHAEIGADGTVTKVYGADKPLDPSHVIVPPGVSPGCKEMRGEWFDADGNLLRPNSLGVLVPEADVITEAEAEIERRLRATDKYVVEALEKGNPVPAEWATYRDAVRNARNQPGWPSNITWPDPPGAAPVVM